MHKLLVVVRWWRFGLKHAYHSFKHILESSITRWCSLHSDRLTAGTKTMESLGGRQSSFILCLIFIDSIFHERLGNVRIWPLLFMQIEFVQRWPSSHTVVISRQIWSGRDESQALPIRGHGCCCYSVGVMGFYAPLTSLLISWRAFFNSF